MNIIKWLCNLITAWRHNKPRLGIGFGDLLQTWRQAHKQLSKVAKSVCMHARVCVCMHAPACSPGCLSTVITSAGGPTSPILSAFPHCSTAMESRCPTLVWGQNWINVQKQMTPSAVSTRATVTGLQPCTAQCWARCHPTLASQTNIHTYYMRIHGKTAWAKGEDGKGGKWEEWTLGRTKLYSWNHLEISFSWLRSVCLYWTSKKWSVSPVDLQGFEEMFCLIGSDGSQYTGGIPP